MRIPILRLDARTLVVVLSADFTDEMVMQFQGELAERVSATEARGAVIDVSALDIVDSFLARVLNDSARMLRLLGAETVLCGVQPAVAMTLVEMGRNLVGVTTAFTLEQALARLRARIERADRLAVDPAKAEDADVPPRH